MMVERTPIWMIRETAGKIAKLLNEVDPSLDMKEHIDKYASDVSTWFLIMKNFVLPYRFLIEAGEIEQIRETALILAPELASMDVSDELILKLNNYFKFYLKMYDHLNKP